MSKKERVQASIIIEASPEKVWSVLTDFEKLNEWSSSFQNLSGYFNKGGQIEVVFKAPFGGDTTMKKFLFLFKEKQIFGWTGVFLMGMKDYHKHSLKELPNGNTEFTQTDRVSGGMSFLLGGMLEKQMQKGYNVFNEELKNRVESL